MEGGLIALALRMTGLGKLWEKIDGCKRYIGAVATMLTGASTMLGAAASELSAFLAAAHDFGSAINFVLALGKNWQTDPTAILFAGGWLLLLQGWKTMAQAHADDKKHDELLAAAAAAPVAAAPAPAAAGPSLPAGAVPVAS